MGIHIQMMDVVLLDTVNGINAQNRMLADKLTTLSAVDRQILIDAISKNESQVETLEAHSQQFRTGFDDLSKEL